MLTAVRQVYPVIIDLNQTALFNVFTREITASQQLTIQGWGLQSKIHAKFHVIQQGFSNIDSDWLAAVLPANQMPGCKIFVN